MLPLNSPERLLAPLVILAVGNDRPVHADSRRHDVNVIVLGVLVPGDTILRALKSHLLTVGIRYPVPLVAAQALSVGQRKACVVDRTL